MIETFHVKHAVGGRSFIDTSKQSFDYTVENVADRWLFTITTPLLPNIEELLKWKDELNVFLFREEPGEPIVKLWFYVKDGPVHYDAERQKLTIISQGQIEYVPERFSSQP
ncbi:MAG: hypothetical protein K6T85_02575 [Gorillibacterium sp.]|nr:hypothetical protein [Gorillibacterium sp.]